MIKQPNKLSAPKSLTHSKAAAFLGITRQKLAYERAVKKSIPAHKGPDGYWRYNIDDLEQSKSMLYRSRSADGELSAQTFEMFKDGKTNVDVVIALRLSPERVRVLRLEFERCEQMLLFSPAQEKELREELSRDGRSCADSQELITNVRELIDIAQAWFEHRRKQSAATPVSTPDHQPFSSQAQQTSAQSCSPARLTRGSA